MQAKLNYQQSFLNEILKTLFACLVFCQYSIAQYNVSYDCASVLGKGQSAISAYYSGYSFNYGGNSIKIFNLLGFRFSGGISESFDLSLSYGRLYGGLLENYGANYIELAPKILLSNSHSKTKLALLLPLGVYFANSDRNFILSPKLLFTYQSSQKLDLSFSPKVEILLESPSDQLIEFSIGAGLSNNLDLWAIRPEIGLVFNPGEKGSIFTYGIGFNYHL